jgi:two-component system sensor histidine kinase CiaH
LKGDGVFQRVKLKITALAVAIVVCIYAVSAITVYGLVRHIVLLGVDSRLNGLVNNLTLKNVEHTVNSMAQGSFMVVEAKRRTVSSPDLDASKLQALQDFIHQANPKARHYVTIWRPNGNTPTRVIDTPVQLESGNRVNVVVGADIASQMDVLYRLEHVLFFVGIAGLFVSAIAGFILAERVLTPIRAAWKRQLEFVGDASHELRTPLAVIQSNLGLVLEHTHQSVVDNLEWIHNAHGESRRLAKLVEDLLTLARGDVEKAPIALQALSLSELAKYVAELFDPVFAARELTPLVDIQEGVQVSGDKDRLHQLMVILIDNACKFTPAGGEIRIHVEEQRGVAVLQVADSGCGIAEKDLPRIFDRFYQTDSARMRSEAHGAGLGLSIAKWIVEAHKGKVTVSSKPGVGTEFSIHIPSIHH